jgi:alpha-tubulin suppressor-like RCC1 family protein
MLTSVYVWGGGEAGQIGNGEKTPQLTPTLTTFPLSLSSDGDDENPSNINDGNEIEIEELQQLCFGDKHAVAVTSRGAVWSWGDSEFGQCKYSVFGGINLHQFVLLDLFADTHTLTPYRICATCFIIIINNNNLFTYLLTSTIRILICLLLLHTGGHGIADRETGSQLLPKRVDALKQHRVKTASCGETVVTVVTDAGVMWSWGSGDTHQLAIMDNVDMSLPMECTALPVGTVVSSVSVGSSISSCSTDSGDVYMWGFSR